MANESEDELSNNDTQTEIELANSKIGDAPTVLTSSLVVKQGTDISVLPPAFVYRPGCPFCLHTLNPNHSDPELRTFVLVKNDFVYHQRCWDKFVSKNADMDGVIPTEISVLPPPPLPMVDRHALVLYVGPSNSLFDEPLGISASIISMDDINPQEFALQNNTDNPIRLSRNLGPGWAYVDLGRYSNVAEWVELPSAEVAIVKVYPHPVRPSIAHINVYLNETQHIQLNASRFTLMPVISAVALLGIGFWHLIAFSNWLTFATLSRLPEGYWGGAWHLVRSGPIGPLTSVVFTGGLLLGWFLFMMPSRALWVLFASFVMLGDSRLISRVARLKRFSRDAQGVVWSQFEQQRISRLIQKPTRLLAFALTSGLGFAVVALPLILLAGLITAILGTGLPSLLVGVAYLVALLLLINTALVDYNIYFLKGIQHVTKRGMDELLKLINDQLNRSKTKVE